MSWDSFLTKLEDSAGTYISKSVDSQFEQPPQINSPTVYQTVDSSTPTVPTGQSGTSAQAFLSNNQPMILIGLGVAALLVVVALRH